MPVRPKLLDLFCGAGGCSVGYHRAGFDVVGVDHRPMPRYPFTFIQADALETLKSIGDRFDVIHASPPCQRYSCVNRRQHMQGREYPDLLPKTRELLCRLGKRYVIENVEAAPMRGAIRLCGSSFGLSIRRHRLFESNTLLLAVPCEHGRHRGNAFPTCFQTKGSPRRTSSCVQVYGHTQGASMWPKAMGIDWMNRDELTQAIPPAYTEFIGKQLMRAIEPCQTPTP